MAAWLIIRKTRTSHIGGEPRHTRPQSPNRQIIKQHRILRSASARLKTPKVPATYRHSHARLGRSGDRKAGGVTCPPLPQHPDPQVELPVMTSRLDGGGDLACAASDFSATLLAMAGHDLRQPLQVIVGAHDLLARITHGGAAQAQLNRAEDATRQLADKLDQLVEALRLRDFATSDHHEPVPLGPVLEQLASEFGEPARLKGVKHHVGPAREAEI